MGQLKKKIHHSIQNSIIREIFRFIKFLQVLIYFKKFFKFKLQNNIIIKL